jgi:hypothetical protein
MNKEEVKGSHAAEESRGERGEGKRTGEERQGNQLRQGGEQKRGIRGDNVEGIKRDDKIASEEQAVEAHRGES